MGIEELGLGADAVEPTYVWSSREGDRARVHVALCASEDDTIVALLAPATLVGLRPLTARGRSATRRRRRCRSTAAPATPPPREQPRRA